MRVGDRSIDEHVFSLAFMMQQQLTKVGLSRVIQRLQMQEVEILPTD